MNAANRPIGIAVVGCGYWGVNYLRVFNEFPDSRAIAACDLRPERLKEAQRRAPSLFLTTQLEEVLALDTVDAVVVCTEATSHYAAARRCVEAGKHTLVEKPLTTSLDDAAELTALAESLGVCLMVGHTFVYHSAIRKMKEYLEGRQDEVYYIHARRTNLGPIRRDVNAVWDLATHDISIMNYLLDSQPEWVSAVGAKVLRNCREDVGFIALGYPNAVLGHIHVSWAEPAKTREIVVVSSDRRIVFNDLNGLEQVRVFEKGIRPMLTEPQTFGEFRLQIRDGDILSPRIEATEPLKNEGRHFLDCIRRGEQPTTGGVQGAEVLQVLKAVDESIAQCGARIEVENYGKYHATQAVGAVR